MLKIESFCRTVQQSRGKESLKSKTIYNGCIGTDTDRKKNNFRPEILGMLARKSILRKQIQIHKRRGKERFTSIK